MGKKKDGDVFDPVPPGEFSFGPDAEINELPIAIYRGDFVDHILTNWMRSQGCEADLVWKWVFNGKGQPIAVRGYEYGTTEE